MKFDKAYIDYRTSVTRDGQRVFEVQSEEDAYHDGFDCGETIRFKPEFDARLNNYICRDRLAFVVGYRDSINQQNQN